MKLRPATIDDARILFDWRNDELTRAMSVNSDPVEWEGHVKWLTARLQRDEPGLFIAEDSEPVGTIRIDGEEISYTVAPSHRGRGVAKAMLSVAQDLFGQKVARIKAENVASIRAAAGAGHIVEILTAHQ
jgi:RimJ/RimL family protein N-acetyltransferase